MSFSQAYGTSDIDQLAFVPMPEQKDGWQGVTNLEGDFYREYDNVVRGATMSPAEVPCLSSFNSPVDGDFYREPGDAAKGTGLGCGPWADLGYSQALAAAPPPLAGNSGLCKVAARRFADADCPPEVPEDPFFTLEKTTLHVTSGRPFEIGNHMLDFLNTQVTASITKVSNKSVAVKADVFVETRMCTLKLRVYRGPQGTHMVEFQRRDGDAVAFGAVFRQAAQYLGARVQVAGAPLQVAPHALQRSPAGIDVEVPPKAMAEATLAPILDLAGPTSSPILQAEAAAMLAETVNKPDAARALFADDSYMEAACVSLKALLECDRTDVAYPTARTLRSMAMWAQSEDCFTTHGLLKTMINKVHSRSCCSLVLRELAQAVAAATPHCVGRLSHEAIHEASFTLGEALQGTEDVIVHQSLQQALLALR